MKKSSRISPTKQAENRRLRALFNKAKRKGLVRPRALPRGWKPSRYMRGKLNQLEPFLSSEYVALKVPARTARLWRDDETGTVKYVSRNRVLVKRSKGEIAKVKGGRIVILKKLKDGEIERVPIPIRLQSFTDFADWSRSDPDLTKLINEDEMWTFRIYGSLASIPFRSLKALINALYRYSIIENDEAFVEAFELMRVRGWPPETDLPYTGAKPPPRKTYSREELYAMNEKRKARARAWYHGLSDDAKERYKAKQRARYQRLDEKGREKHREKARSRYQNMSEKEKEEYKRTQRERYRMMSGYYDKR